MIFTTPPLDAKQERRSSVYDPIVGHLRERIEAPARAARAFAYVRLLSAVTNTAFDVGGQTYHYHWHASKATWRNERAVELPIALAELADSDPARTLEVGNVLPQYLGHPAHRVIDLYETDPRVERADAADYSGGPFDLIVSVSTLEHVGLNEDVSDPGKATRAVRNLLGLLAPGGTMLITVPMGYNPGLQHALTSGELGGSVRYLKRTGRLRWRECSASEADVAYGWDGSDAAAIAVARWVTPH